MLNIKINIYTIEFYANNTKIMLWVTEIIDPS